VLSRNFVRVVGAFCGIFINKVVYRQADIISVEFYSTTAYFLSFPKSVIGNPGFSMLSGFWVKPGMTAKSH